MLLMAKDSTMCINTAEAFPVAKTTSFAKWSSHHHNDGIQHQVLWQNFGEIRSNAFWTPNFSPVQDDCWVSVHSHANERSSAQGLLGLVLVWTHIRGLLNVLQLVFDNTYSNLSVYLRFGMCLISETFCRDPLARVSISSGEEIESFEAAFAAQQQWWMARSCTCNK